MLHSLESLEVVGIAGSRRTNPGHETPIFRLLLEVEIYLVPPFRVKAEEVDGGDLVGPAFIKDRVSEDEAVLLDRPIMAQPGYCLWRNVDGVIQYTNTDDAKQAMEKIAGDLFIAARTAAMCGDFKEAKIAIGKAIPAGGSSLLDILLLRGAIEVVQNSEADLRITSEALLQLFPEVSNAQSRIRTLSRDL